jgi:hypothetical protein
LHVFEWRSWSSPVIRSLALSPAHTPEWFYALWCMPFETVLFSRTCAKKKTAHKRRPESREETPKEANAASLLHCNNDLGTSLVQRKRRIKCLPLFFAKLRDFGASLSTALHHRPIHSSSSRRTNANRLGSSTLSSADLILQSEECRKPHGTRGRADHIGGYQYGS